MVTFPLSGEARTLILPVSKYFTEGLGKYRVKLRAEFSDTVPSFSESEWVEVEVVAVPSETLINNAIAAPLNNAVWEAVAESTVTTIQQKAIARDMILLNNEIASGVDFGVPLSEVTNDRTRYLEELAAGTTEKTFSAWIRQQANIQDPIEQQEAKDFVAAAPTSSINALLSYFNQKKHPYRSLIRLMLGGIPGYSDGDWTFVRNNAQSYGGTVPDNTILADYRQYQTAMQTANLVMSFEDWIEQN